MSPRTSARKSPQTSTRKSPRRYFRACLTRPKIPPTYFVGTFASSKCSENMAGRNSGTRLGRNSGTHSGTGKRRARKTFGHSIHGVIWECHFGILFCLLITCVNSKNSSKSNFSFTEIKTTMWVKTPGSQHATPTPYVDSKVLQADVVQGGGLGHQGW